MPTYRATFQQTDHYAAVFTNESANQDVLRQIASELFMNKQVELVSESNSQWNVIDISEVSVPEGLKEQFEELRKTIDIEPRGTVFQPKSATFQDWLTTTLSKSEIDALLMFGCHIVPMLNRYEVTNDLYAAYQDEIWERISTANAVWDSLHYSENGNDRQVYEVGGFAKILTNEIHSKLNASEIRRMLVWFMVRDKALILLPG